MHINRANTIGVLEKICAKMHCDYVVMLNQGNLSSTAVMLWCLRAAGNP
jgi:hypothetical protein